MNEVQKQLLSMYCDIKAILDKHKVRYFLHYGTALGAIRHNGFIPWDDDIDILVEDRDLDKVNSILSSELDGEKYYYHVPSADTHPHVLFRTPDFSKDLKEKKAPFIDIFVLERYPDHKARQVLVDVMIACSVIFVTTLDHLNSLTAHKLLSVLPRWFEKNAKRFTNPNSGLCTIYSTTFKKEVMPHAYFENEMLHEFEGIVSPLPKETDKVLTHLFGDYMTPPPENERKGASGYPCSIYKDYCLDEQK